VKSAEISVPECKHFGRGRTDRGTYGEKGRSPHPACRYGRSEHPGRDEDHCINREPVKEKRKHFAF